MNYELLKLSKILPTIKGRKTLEIYEESLEKLRQKQAEKNEAAAESKITSPKTAFSTLESHSNLLDLPKKGIRPLKEVKSADSLAKGKLSGFDTYANLNQLLNEPAESEELCNMLRKEEAKAAKSNANSQMNTATSFFGKKEFKDVDDPNRPVTTGPQANFVFKKKKILLRNESEYDHIYQYSIGTGLVLPTNDEFGLSGIRVNLRGISTEVVAREQKRYLKNLKQDPMATFHSEKSPEGSSAQAHLSHSGAFVTEKRAFLTPYQAVREVRARKYGSNLNTGSQRLNTLVLDGKYLKSFDARRANQHSPVIPPRTSKAQMIGNLAF